MNIAVLAGGTSDERDVSLRSGQAVAAALNSLGHTVRVLDPATGLQELLGELRQFDVVFPALHGTGGEDGSIQKLLEERKIPFAGSGSAASALCFDKCSYGEIIRDRGVIVPATELVSYEHYCQSNLIHRPYVLKPNDGGSSIDTFIIRNPAEADDSAIRAAFDRHGKLLLQELIEGQEITVAILGEEALPVIEIVPPSGEEFDYENKYNGASQELCPPVNVSEDAQAEARQTAESVHKLTGCAGMSRTDIMIAKDGTQYVLETNTIPGLTDQSLLPKAAQAAGYSMPELCQRLVNEALTRS